MQLSFKNKNNKEGDSNKSAPKMVIALEARFRGDKDFESFYQN